MPDYQTSNARLVSMWDGDYQKAVANGNAESGRICALQVEVHRWGTVAIYALVTRPDMDAPFRVSPYFSQGDDGSTDQDDIDANGVEQWLDVMYGATDWADWQWDRA